MTKYTKTIAMTKGGQKVSILSLFLFYRKKKKTVTEKEQRWRFFSCYGREKQMMNLI